MNTYFYWSCMALVVMGTVAIRGAIAKCNNYEDSSQSATIGQKMVLSCTLDEPCFLGQYEWYRIVGPNNETLREMSNELVVCENVISAAEVGGRVYECYCSNTTICRRFKLGVNPKVQLSTSAYNNVTKSGSSINVTCTAESYPPTNSVNDYLMKHPNNTPIVKELLPGMYGVVHRIAAATKQQDSGIYECSVNVTLDEYPGKPLDSEVAIVNLTVYDTPFIVRVQNVTLYLDIDVEQSAILECAVSNTEDNLEVWVNWTTIDGKEIKKEHVTLRKGDVFYLLLYNAIAADYMCQLFSTYSPNDVEDKQVVAVMYSVLTPKTENCELVGIVSFLVVVVVMLLVATIISTALALTFYQKLKKSKNSASIAVSYHQRRTNNYEQISAPTDHTKSEGGHSSKNLEGKSVEYYNSEREDGTSLAAKMETHPSPVPTKSFHNIIPGKSPDSSPASLRKKRMSWTKRLSDSFKLSTTSTTSEETQVLISGEIPEESHKTDASVTKTLGDVTDETSERGSGECHSKGERKESMKTEMHLPPTTPPPQSSSFKKQSSTSPISAARSIRQSSTTSTNSTSEAEKGIHKSNLDIFLKASGSTVDDDSKD